MTLGEFVKWLALCGLKPGSGGGSGAGAARVIAQHSVPASVTGTTDTTTLATIAIPGGTLHESGALRVTTLWSYTNSANAKVLQVQFGGSVFLNQSQTATSSSQAQTIVRNRGAANSQVGFAAAAANQYSSSGAAVVVAAVDTTKDQQLVLTARLANVAETITLESYTVEVLNP
ncbi:hypothetical protein [Burkholderia cenocepacia]|uniref:hypothetical protein n=1 Tax=Burkholderia cenocepacia TaxID=95486 RepID=UPI0022374A23|nr:hypothetical protein [Burkholderia cenocepacia]MCW5141070.1 hypothetical protein [Burkholderia cenocepacia]